MSANPNSASLYVGDIENDVTESDIFTLMKEVGPVLSIRVCRDAVTRRSLGYAYVNFQNPTDAERALETLNYHRLKEKPIRIMWSHRDPGLRKSGVGNVFIKNLHPEIDNQTLYDTFSQFGNILSCKVSTNPMTGESRKYGFVHFEAEESARVAIEKVNGMLLKGEKVFVGRFIRRAQRLAQSQAQFTNIYVKNLKNGTDEDVVKTHFSKFGEIDAFALKEDKKGRPFAFINYKTHEAAQQSVEESNETHVDGLCEDDQKLYVSRAQKKSEREEELKKQFAQRKAKRINEFSGHNLYVKNLDENVDDAGLRSAFERFGEITSCKVMLDEKDPPVSKGFGFVCFKELDAANKAIAEMNGYMLGAKPLYVNVAQRKEVRRATLEIQYASRLGPRAVGGNAPTQQALGVPYGYQPPYFGTPPQPYPYPMQGRAAGVGPGPRWAQQPGAPFPFGMPQPAPGGMRGQAMGRGGGRTSSLPRGVGVAPTMARMAPGRGPSVKATLPGVPAVPPQAGLTYTKQARNREQVSMHTLPAQAMMAPQAAIPGLSGQEPLTAAGLAAMTAEQQKNTLGERLFARISETHPESAAKITGMLLEMEVSEQLNLLESPDMLAGKISEALEVLKAHEESAHR
jgi:polyadenylate-binding protein